MKNLLLSLPLFFSSLCFSQSFQYDWAFGLKSSYYSIFDNMGAVTKDASGNIYYTNSFGGTVDFDPSSGVANLTSGAKVDIFIAKYSPSGAYLWAVAFGGPETEKVYGISLDALGNIYVTGTFVGTADFNPGSGVYNMTAAGTGTTADIFVAKYNPSGAFGWAFQIGNTSMEEPGDIVADAAGNVYITGTYSGTVDFNPSSSIANNLTSGGWNSYIAKYSSAGAYSWAIGIGANGSDRGKSLTLDGAGNVVATGSFESTTDFDPSGSTANLTASLSDIYVAKYTPAGNYLMAIKMGSLKYDVGFSVTSDASSNIYLTGYFQDTADFDPSNAVANVISGNTNNSAFLAKYNSSGNYQWALGLASTSCGFDVKLDATGNVNFTGFLHDTSDFNPSSGVAKVWSNGPNSDAFLAKYSPAGAYLAAFSTGGTQSDAGYHLATDALDNTYAAGAFQNTVDFDPSSNTANQTASPLGFYLARYSYSTTTSENERSLSSVRIYPNPARERVFIEGTGSGGSFTLMDLQGRTLYSAALNPSGTTEIDLSEFLPGIYLLRCTAGNESRSSRLLIL